MLIKRIAFLVIIIAAATSGFAVKAVLENDQITAFLRDFAPWIGVAALAGLAILAATLTIGYFYARHRLRKLLNAETCRCLSSAPLRCSFTEADI